MKKLLVIALITVSFTACNDGQKKEDPTPTSDSLVKEANDLADSAEKMMADSSTKMMTDSSTKMNDKTKKQ